LLPEATGNEILDDVKDFWLWVQRDLVKEIAGLERNIEPDVNNIAVRGESAGSS
jgi:acetyl esterase/lipase